MQAEELTAEFGIAGILDFVQTEHGLVKAAISQCPVGTTCCIRASRRIKSAFPPSDRGAGDANAPITLATDRYDSLGFSVIPRVQS